MAPKKTSNNTRLHISVTVQTSLFCPANFYVCLRLFALFPFSFGPFLLFFSLTSLVLSQFLGLNASLFWSCEWPLSVRFPFFLFPCYFFLYFLLLFFFAYRFCYCYFQFIHSFFYCYLFTSPLYRCFLFFVHFSCLKIVGPA